MANHCLVISPFVPRITDAGHRKRTFESCCALAREGYTLTFVHLCFEGKWYWRRQDPNTQELAACGITSYHEIYADDLVSKPPASGELHQLDEWWHPGLEAFLINHLRRNAYEVVLVHNVWLSKAFDFFPPYTVRLIETHDIFSARARQFAAIGAVQDFYACSENDEVFGLNRAQAAIAIKQEDEDWIRQHSRTRAITVTSMPSDAVVAGRTSFLHPEKISVGFMGSDHAFNVHCLSQFLYELNRAMLVEPCPLEIVLAGTVTHRLPSELLVATRNLGFVSRVDDFYDAIDLVFSPLDFGTGVKIKVAEAIDKGMPVLATQHSAQGTHLSRESIVADKYQLVRKLLELATSPRNHGKLKRTADLSRAAARSAYRDSSAQLHQLLLEYRTRYVVYAPELLLDAHSPAFASIACTLRLYAEHGLVHVLATSEAARDALLKIVETMPAGVSVFMAPCADTTEADTYLDLIDDDLARLLEGAIFHTTRSRVKSTSCRYVVWDARHDPGAQSHEVGHVYRIDPQCLQRQEFFLPYFSNSLWWDPAIRHPSIYEGLTIVIRAQPAQAAALRAYHQAFRPDAKFVAYANDDELVNRAGSLLGAAIFGNEVRMSSMSSGAEKALAEFLKCFGSTVHLGLRDKTVSPKNSLLSIDSHERFLTARTLASLHIEVA